MAALNPARLLWRLRWALQRPAAGPLLLALSLLLLAAAWAWQQQVGQRWQALPVAAPSPAAAGPGREAQDRQAGLRGFYAALPAADELPTQLQALIDLAAQHGLRLQIGSYRLEAEPQARFARCRMSLPVRGPARQVQPFLQAALAALPTLAIDSLQIRRDGEAGQLLDARVQWVLYLQADGRPAATAAAQASPGARGTP